MDDLKVITASNIINLRTAKGLTQAELGELLSYSDKSISKWERAEAVPDAYVLKKMSEIFGVSVDYILSSHDSWEKPESFKKAERNFHSKILTVLVIFGIWTIAFLVYVIGWVNNMNWWLLFVYALPVSLITLLVLNSVWEQGKNNRHIICGLVASVILTVYLTFFSFNPWQILIMIVPAELIVFLSFRIKKSRK